MFLIERFTYPISMFKRDLDLSFLETECALFRE